MKALWSFFVDTIETIVIAAAIFVVVYLFLIQPHQIRGVSMVPTFHDREYILTDKVSYRFSNPERGDIIVFQAPKDHELDFIKRIIGLPGERVKIQNGSVYIYNDKNPNGVKLNEPYLADPSTSPGDFASEGEIITLGENEYFVMGDNRPRSSDSRVWGPIQKNEIVGRAWVRYWPLNKIKLVPGLKYGV